MLRIPRLFHFRRSIKEADDEAMRFSETPQIEPMEESDILLRLIPLYLQSCEDAEVSQRTIKNYKLQLKPFEAWLLEVGPANDWELTPDSFKAYARWLRDGSFLTRHDKPPAYNSRSTYLKRVRHLLSWCHRAGHTDGNIAAWVPQLSQKPREMRPMDVRTIVSLLMACETGGHERNRERNRAVIALSLGTGARREEICEIQIRNINFFDDCSGTIYLVVTKGDKPRTIIFGPSTGKLLKLHMDVLPSGEKRLFNVQPPALWKVVAALVDRAGVPESNLHDHRKFFVSYWYFKYPERDTPDKFVLDLQLGHAPQSVQHKHYVFMNTEHIRDFFVSPMEDPLVAEYVAAL